MIRALIERNCCLLALIFRQRLAFSELCSCEKMCGFGDPHKVGRPDKTPTFPSTRTLFLFLKNVGVWLE